VVTAFAIAAIGRRECIDRGLWHQRRRA
jgi:hypothetical protein